MTTTLTDTEKRVLRAIALLSEAVECLDIAAAEDGNLYDLRDKAIILKAEIQDEYNREDD